MSDKHRLELIKRYFRQQRELFGDEVWSSGVKNFVEARRSEPPVKKRRAAEVKASTKPAVPADSRTQPLFIGGDNPGLRSFYHQIKDCLECSLGRVRTNFVFGAGNPNADLLFVGEAPGYNEDQKGEPFVGRAGKLLDKLLADVGLDRSKVYIANILKCRPPQNRDPNPLEVASCIPYLKKQIELIRPEIIVALGRVAGQTLLNTTIPIGKLRGSLYQFQGIDLIVTYHPAALLRNNRLIDPANDDLQRMLRLYHEKREEKE
ncbi:uracil-DNA glycosylase [candidate division KSB1 bacterium]